MKVVLAIVFLFISLQARDIYKRGDVVVDRKHNLIWQDAKDNIMLRMTHQEAFDYCQKLSHIGLNSWRLPTVEEYKTIIDKTRKDEIMIDRAFKYIMPVDYWADDRTWVRNFGRYGYYIFFKSGTAYYQNRTYQKFVRCVRNLD